MCGLFRGNSKKGTYRTLVGIKRPFVPRTVFRIRGENLLACSLIPNP
jgi:hypothetical protein